MADDPLLEVHKQLRTVQDKYTYFLLAAAASAVALALNRTQGRVLEWSMIPLAIAVLFWGASFFCGCRYLVYIGSILRANFELLRVQKGMDPELGDNSELIALASGGIREAIEYNSDRGGRFARWQFYCLIAGALAYIAWHIWEMYLRTLDPGRTLLANLVTFLFSWISEQA
jgi:hypothetical protein